MTKIIVSILITIILISCSCYNVEEAKVREIRYKAAVDYIINLDKTKDFFKDRFSHDNFNYCLKNYNIVLPHSALQVKFYLIDKYGTEDVSYEQKRQMRE